MNCPVLLSDLPLGTPARITAIGGTAAWQRRLAAVGLTVGQTVTPLRRAPCSQTLAVRVGALTDVAIRAGDAGTILVEPLGPP
ncbi:ferrous iron uptake system accessory component FeoA [Thermosynechococcus sp. NK55a]|jgi:ferrous iron transport protein A|uniref:FeoA family protein n=1 Tax=unclassified Thermosynechococcus TaxID=2622553 RepID=UPI0003D8A3C1|nr:MULTISPECIES: FeoA family protein [unclassified Thermosynechococcus]AHB88098.1 ferrous iron uptake system accessory component FeoA [Thermosynechococcus sp. NK55a]RMH65518.1 MAG: ferrous iron transport protein A [Cyanobacteria bacterium J003]BCX13139.1 MAG: ferrous iron transporter A [Thermosynechococcus sp.]HIK23551.1 ferrous iron transport protein A [Thermosynechococcus sp. M3746_W2019_013]